MNIYILDTESQYLQVEFTEDEVKHELFNEAVKKVNESVFTELNENILHIMPNQDQRMDDMGKLDMYKRCQTWKTI